MSPHLQSALMTLAGFMSGSLMFSLWLGRLRGGDPLRVGDGNPGAANAFRSGGAAVGVAALLLDFLKGAIPVALARWNLHLDGWLLAPVAVYVGPRLDRWWTRRQQALGYQPALGAGGEAVAARGHP